VPITNQPPPVNPAAKAAKPKADSAVTKARAETLVSLGQIAQVPLIATKQFADAGAVALHWPNVAREVARLAESQPQIAKLVDPLMQVGPYAGLITAVLPFVLQLGVNHGRVPAGAMGTVPATSLAAQIETSLAKQELEALKIQFDAEKEANDTRAEIQKQRDEFSFFKSAEVVSAA
jgi:hypothetical protein